MNAFSRRLSPLLATAVVASTLALVAATPGVAHAAGFIGQGNVPVIGVGETSIAFTGADGQNPLTITDLPVGSSGGVALSPNGHSGLFTKGLAPKPANGTVDDPDQGFTTFDAFSRSVGATTYPQLSCYDGQKPAYSPDGQFIAVLCSSRSIYAVKDRLMVLHATDASLAYLRDYPAGSNLAGLAWAPDGMALYLATSGIDLVPFSSGSGLGTDQVVDAGDGFADVKLAPSGAVVGTSRNTIDGERIHSFTPWPGSGTWAPTDTHFPLPEQAGEKALTIAADGVRAVVQPNEQGLATIDLTTGATTATQSVTLGGYSIGGFAISAFNGVHVITSNRSDWRMDDWVLAGDGSFSDVASTSTPTTTYPLGAPAIGTASAPIASFTNTAVTDGTPVTFDASSSQIATSTATYGWDWNNDGTIDTVTTSPTTTHQFPGVGAYNVSLTVTDATGAGDATTSFWDGTRFVRRGLATAKKTRLIYVNGASSLDLQVTPKTLVRGGHFHVNLTLHYPGGTLTNSENHITLRENGQSITGSQPGECQNPLLIPQTPTNDTATVSCDGTVESTVGPVAWTAYFDGGNGGLVAAADAQQADTEVLPVTSAIALSGVPAELPSSNVISATGTVAAGCGGGTYTFIVDRRQVTTATEIPASSSHTFSTTVPAGRHTVRIAWIPADTSCTASATTEMTTVAGPNLTATTLTALKPRPGLGPAQVTAVVSSPGGAPDQGTITIKDSTKVIATAPVDATGKAVLSPTLTTYGPHTLTAVFTYPTGAYVTSTSAAIVITVQGVPGTATVTGTSPKPGRLLVGVKADSHGSPITSFKVICTSKGHNTGTAVGSGPTVLVGGLHNNANYVCTASATNALGTGVRGPAVKGRPGKLPKLTLKALAPTVVKGDRERFTGTLTAADQPQTHRVVELTVRKPGSKKRTTIAKVRTDSKGRFTFYVKVKAKAIYQAHAAVGPSMVSNPEVTIRVTNRAV